MIIKVATFEIKLIVLIAFYPLAVFTDELLPVSQQCMICICEANSGCDVGSGCEGAVCGPFRLTLGEWADAGKPMVNDDIFDPTEAFENCARDTYCSTLVIQGYMRAFQNDCNGDGKIDCDDFVAIHKLGPLGCRGAKLLGIYGGKYEECKAIVGATDSED